MEVCREGGGQRGGGSTSLEMAWRASRVIEVCRRWGGVISV